MKRIDHKKPKGVNQRAIHTVNEENLEAFQRYHRRTGFKVVPELYVKVFESNEVFKLDNVRWRKIDSRRRGVFADNIAFRPGKRETIYHLDLIDSRFGHLTRLEMISPSTGKTFFCWHRDGIIICDEEDEEMKSLYKVRLRGMKGSYPVTYGVSYVVANDADSAYRKVREYLDEKKIGFTRDRTLESIELVAEATAYPDTGIILYL